MKYFILLALTCTLTSSYGQGLPDFTQITLSKAADYKTAEPAVLQASHYVLSTPFNKDDQSRLYCTQFILKWMTGTPDFSFSLSGKPLKAFKDDVDLLGLYIAAMTKYSIENPAIAKNQDSVCLQAMTIELNYCNNPSNNMKMNKPMKKLWEDLQDGTLSEALK
jgi:hypothetical protein